MNYAPETNSARPSKLLVGVDEIWGIDGQGLLGANLLLVSGRVHPRKSMWKLTITCLKREIIFQTSIFWGSMLIFREGIILLRMLRSSILCVMCSKLLLSRRNGLGNKTRWHPRPFIMMLGLKLEDLPCGAPGKPGRNVHPWGWGLAPFPKKNVTTRMIST